MGLMGWKLPKVYVIMHKNLINHFIQKYYIITEILLFMQSDRITLIISMKYKLSGGKKCLRSNPSLGDSTRTKTWLVLTNPRIMPL